MAGKLTFSLEEYQEAAVKYRSELLLLPIFGAMSTLQYMTPRPGIRYKERVGDITTDAQFGPYDPKRKADANLHLNLRTLETFFGSVVTEFEPNTAITTLLGIGATQGDGQKAVPTAKHVLEQITRSLSEHLNDCLWNAKRNSDGTTTAELFNGWDTITQREIDDENIAASKGNYLELTEEITAQNCCDVMKEILFGLDPHMRTQEINVYCSQELVDKYNESYLLTHGGIMYNTQYGQNVVEGSEGRMKFVPLYNKANSNFIHISPKRNMLYGYDGNPEGQIILVDRFSSFILTYTSTIFFGCEFETLDKRRLKVIRLYQPAVGNEPQQG